MFPISTLLLLAAAAPVPAADQVYRVRDGDTLIGVRDRLLQPEVRWQALQKRNRVADPLRLRPGSELRIPADWLREQPSSVEVLQLQGTVWRERQGQRQRLAAGELLQDGDRLISDAQSSATLRFADGTRSLLRPDSALELQQLRKLRQGARSQVQLLQGAVDTEVPPQAGRPAALPRFELRTPVANLGVRGTRFRGRWQQGALALEVLEGQVMAQAPRGKAAAVGAGLGWLSAGGGVAPLPAPPQLAALAGQTLQRLPVQLQWPAQPGVSGWRVQWWDASGQQLLLDGETASPQFIGAAELPDADYRLRIRARSDSGLEGQDAEVAVRLHARPEPPVLQEPAAQLRAYAERYAFAWTRPAGATAYWLQIADDAEFRQLRHDERALREPRHEVELPVGEHHWRVAALRADGRPGPWGDGQRLTRLPLPPAPPPAEPQRDGNQLVLRWAASPLPGARYQVQMAPAGGDAGFSQPWLDQTLEQPMLQLALTQTGPQQLRIRVLNADGVAGPWGSPQQFDGARAMPWWLLALPLLLLL